MACFLWCSDWCRADWLRRIAGGLAVGDARLFAFAALGKTVGGYGRCHIIDKASERAAIA